MIKFKKNYFYYKSKLRLFYLRPLRASDKDYLKEGYGLLSLKSKFQRFFSYQSELSEEQLKFYTETDGQDHVAWGILNVSRLRHIPAGTGRYIKLKNEPGMAEVAITIVDQFHNFGLGSLMVALLNFVASHSDIKKFRYHIHESNKSILKLLQGIGKQVGRIDHSTTVIEADIICNILELKALGVNQSYIDAMEYVQEQFK